jgi:hypothetical protein
LETSPLPGSAGHNAVLAEPSTCGASAGNSADANSSEASAAALDADVEIDVAWPLRRPSVEGQEVRGSDSPSLGSDLAENICAVDFGRGDATEAPAESNVLKLDFGRTPAGIELSDTTTQLPDGEGSQAKIAALSLSTEPVPGAARAGTTTQPLSLSAVTAKDDSGLASEVTGITVAKQLSDMDSTNGSNSESSFLERHEKALEELEGITVQISREDVRLDELSTRSLGATEWQVGRPVGIPDRLAPEQPGLGVETNTAVERADAVERLSQLVLRETSLARQHGPESMAVVLRPDPATELFVHFTSQRNGQVQATVRCERGDFQHLSVLWTQLQEALALHKVTLAPLQESSAGAGPNANGGGNAPTGSGSDLSSSSSPGSEASGFGQSQNAPERRGTPQNESMVERPVPASAASASTRGERGSRPTLATSRPGWETWA